MTTKHSLRQVLARQWIVFTLVLFSGFAAMSVLLLFILEDSFIDQRLREVAADIVAIERKPLPSGFERYALETAPQDLRDRMQHVRMGGIREFRQNDDRYVHVLVSRTANDDVFLLAYDVSHRMRVNQALARAWPWLILVAAATAACAYALARRFVNTVSARTHRLMQSLTSETPQRNLRALAHDEPIREFSALANFAAQAWESRLAALERERDTLSFLGHELRTPLQSVRNSLALLESDRSNDGAWLRLRRAQQRLNRASHSVLWLMSTAEPESIPTARVTPIVEELAVEFAPLAAQRGQRLDLHADADTVWPMPPEVIETILANLLLNAIQHGGPGVVRLVIDRDSAEIENAAATKATSQGFGIGLALVERLLQRFGWRLEHCVWEHDGHTNDAVNRVKFTSKNDRI